MRANNITGRLGLPDRRGQGIDSARVYRHSIRTTAGRAERETVIHASATLLADYLDKRGAVGPQGRFDGRLEIMRSCYSQSNRSERLCEPQEIRIDQIHGFAPSMVLRILQSRYTRQATIVDYDSDDINAVLNRGRQFLTRHQETAVTADRDHLAVWKRASRPRYYLPPRHPCLFALKPIPTPNFLACRFWRERD